MNKGLSVIDMSIYYIKRRPLPGKAIMITGKDFFNRKPTEKAVYIQFSSLITNGEALMEIGITPDLVDDDKALSIRMYARYFTNFVIKKDDCRNLLKDPVICVFVEDDLTREKLRGILGSRQYVFCMRGAS